MGDIINSLKTFGFTETEAKVYIALLQNGDCTGYEASKYSGVPRSKVYAALGALVGRGVLATTLRDKTSVYRAKPVEQLTALIRNQTEDSLLRLEEEARVFEAPRDGDQIWRLTGYESILNKCAQLIEQATQELLIQIWKQDLDSRLEQCIADKQKELGRVLVILYDMEERYETIIPKFYPHGFESDKMTDAGSRWITISADNREMVHVSIQSKERASAIFTRNASMVFFANEYIKHDAYCLRLIDHMGERVKAVFGEDMEGIRDVFAIQ